MRKMDIPAVEFSPRTWRCFYKVIAFLVLEKVFSTHVEVFPNAEAEEARKNRFLHARGGVSGRWPFINGHATFSPRTWRCFRLLWFQYQTGQVFSTHVEVEHPLHSVSGHP